MDTRRLRYALAVAEHLGFERAARALGVSQSTVSRGVDGLEQELGLTLFERSGSGARITPAGRLVLERAKRPLNDLETWAAYARSAGLSEYGSLGVGFYGDLTAGPLREILAGHRRNWAEVSLVFLEDAPAGQVAALRDRRIDIAFLMAVEDAQGAESEQLWTEPIYAAMAENHPRAG